MPDQRLASISIADVLALLDKEEQSELFNRIDFSVTHGGSNETLLTIGKVIAEIVQLRQPFITMMSEIAILLTRLEAAIRGNIRFAILPLHGVDLSLDFGPQVRKAIATALCSRTPIDHNKLIAGQLRKVHRAVRSLCRQVEPTQITRLTPLGEQISDLAAHLEVADPFLAEQYRNMATCGHPVSYTSDEYSSADRDGLRSVGRQIFALDKLVNRLQRNSTYLLESFPDIRPTLRRCLRRVRAKLQESRPVSESEPYASPTISDKDMRKASGRIAQLREAILAVCDYVDTIGNQFDFLNLNLWKHRWRVYELWVLSHIALQLMDMGAEIEDSSRVIDGEWRLKFAKDTFPALGLVMDSQIIDIFYQLFQPGDKTGDMPDIAVRLRGDRFIAIVDPKHGHSYSRGDLSDVCVRYLNAFDPHLSCVVNYFNVRDSEEVNNSPISLVLYGVQPQTRSCLRFDEAVVDAMSRLWRERGIGAIDVTTVIVLFDGSPSTVKCRESLLVKFDQMLSGSGRLSLQSRAVVFGDCILREGAISELSSRELLRGLPQAGTDLPKAFQCVRDSLSTSPFPRELWIFTDGQVGNVMGLGDEIRSTVSRVRIVESTCHDASALKELCERIGGQYVRL